MMILLTVVVIAATVVALIYNQLVRDRNRVDAAWSDIDVQLKRRYDLIPSLIESVKGYMEHERGTLEAVINARNSSLNGLQKAAANPADPSTITANVIESSCWYSHE